MNTFWKACIFLTIIGSAYSGIQYYRNIEQTKTDIQELKTRLSETQEALGYKKAEWTKFESLQTKAAQASTKEKDLKQQKEEWTKKLSLSEVELKNLAQSTREAAEKIRASAANSVSPEFKLADGKVLKDVKIRKIEGNQVSVIHSEGSGSLTTSQLPPELLEKFDMGSASLATALTTVETDILSGVTRVVGLTMKCPIPLSEKPYHVDLAAVTEAIRFEGKTDDDMEVSVVSIRYAEGTVFSMDGAVNGTLKSVSSLEGISNIRHQTQDTTISNFAAKRVSMSANRFGGEVFTEYLFIYDGERFRMIQTVFTNKSKGARAIAESILASVKVEPSP